MGVSPTLSRPSNCLLSRSKYLRLETLGGGCLGGFSETQPPLVSCASLPSRLSWRCSRLSRNRGTKDREAIRDRRLLIVATVILVVVAGISLRAVRGPASKALS